METNCIDMGIPFLNISGVGNPENIKEILEQSSPKVILSSIEDISREEIQSQLQLLKIAYVAIDECQVDFQISCSSLRYKLFFIKILYI